MDIELADLHGLWQREIINFEDGGTESSELILWMQAGSLYGDLRIPYDLSPFPPDKFLEDLVLDELVELARCGGFGGTFSLQGSTCSFERVVDWRPDTGVPDMAEVALDGIDLIENGGACRGHQIWRRRTDPRCAALGLALQDVVDGRSGFLVVLEGQFLYVRGRSSELQAASSLVELVKAAADVASARRLFDAEVSHGRVHDGDTLIVDRSTLPWQVGTKLCVLRPSPAVKEIIKMHDRDPSGATRGLRWSVTASEVYGKPGAWMRTPPGRQPLNDWTLPQ
jgi:allophanate hydrolase